MDHAVGNRLLGRIKKPDMERERKSVCMCACACVCVYVRMCGGGKKQMKKEKERKERRERGKHPSLCACVCVSMCGCMSVPYLEGAAWPLNVPLVEEGGEGEEAQSSLNPKAVAVQLRTKRDTRQG